MEVRGGRVGSPALCVLKRRKVDAIEVSFTGNVYGGGDGVAEFDAVRFGRGPDVEAADGASEGVWSVGGWELDDVDGFLFGREVALSHGRSASGECSCERVVAEDFLKSIAAAPPLSRGLHRDERAHRGEFDFSGTDGRQGGAERCDVEGASADVLLMLKGLGDGASSEVVCLELGHPKRFPADFRGDAEVDVHRNIFADVQWPVGKLDFDECAVVRFGGPIFTRLLNAECHFGCLIGGSVDLHGDGCDLDVAGLLRNGLESVGERDRHLEVVDDSAHLRPDVPELDSVCRRKRGVPLVSVGAADDHVKLHRLAQYRGRGVEARIQRDPLRE